MRHYKVTVKIEEVKEEKPIIKGKYIIPHSNYSKAYIMGIPCKIMSEPYEETHDGRKTFDIKVQSCLTGIIYTIPYSPDWIEVYENFDDVLAKCRRFLEEGFYFNDTPDTSDVEQVIHKVYFPIDNSWTSDFYGHWFPVSDGPVEIISLPFMGDTDFGKKLFVLVAKEDGSVGRCLFEEWKLLP